MNQKDFERAFAAAAKHQQARTALHVNQGKRCRGALRELPIARDEFLVADGSFESPDRQGEERREDRDSGAEIPRRCVAGHLDIVGNGDGAGSKILGIESTATGVAAAAGLNQRCAAGGALH